MGRRAGETGGRAGGTELAARADAPEVCATMPTPIENTRSIFFLTCQQLHCNSLSLGRLSSDGALNDTHLHNNVKLRCGRNRREWRWANNALLSTCSTRCHRGCHPEGSRRCRVGPDFSLQEIAPRYIAASVALGIVARQVEALSSPFCRRSLAFSACSSATVW